MRDSQTTVVNLAAKLRNYVLEPIKHRLIGKEEIIEVLGVALVAGENAFLLGPPGTGKSAIVHEIAARLSGRSFDYLLTRFTEPSELFGPFDLRRLRDGDLVTNTEGMLPEADFVFLDELLNANSAILNSLLLALNERIFRRGRETSALPMLLAVGASNRLPEDETLGALFDRFLLRIVCDNVADDMLDRVLLAGWQREHRVAPDQQMQIDDVRTLCGLIPAVDLQPAKPAYIELIQRLRRAGMPISDRRAVRLQRVLAASAIVCGRLVAEVSDLWFIRYIWNTPEQTEMLASHLDALERQFTSASTDNVSVRCHPLAEDTSGPDPEALAAAIDSIVRDQQQPAAVDQLALLAARVQWVQNAAARSHLEQSLAEAMHTIVPTDP